MDRIVQEQQGPQAPHRLGSDAAASLAALLDDSLRRHRALPAFRYLGRSIGYARVDDAARALAAWLQSAGIVRGDRVALMMPNVPSLPVAVLAVLRAGAVVVNVNPWLEAHDLAHQLQDSGARLVIVLDAFAARLQPVLPRLPVQRVLVAACSDLMGPLHGPLFGPLLGRGYPRVPAFQIPGALRLRRALAQGRRLVFAPPAIGADDLAVLQYTGGTTGVARGDAPRHHKPVANVLQNAAWLRPALQRLPPDVQPVAACALPMTHIYGFTVDLLLGLHLGHCGLLLPQAHDAAATLKTLERQPVHLFAGTELLFDALSRHADAARVDWSALVLALGGGMAVQAATAERWRQLTGRTIVQGYGLTEAGPGVSCNPVDAETFDDSIGQPLPGTELRLIDDGGRDVAPGQPGEIAIRGPQVMAGYWQRPDETARATTADGFLRSGDIAVRDASGALRIVDRKKDLMFVSGFHVFPTEVETVAARLHGVAECAAVGVPDERIGEAVTLLVVKTDPDSAYPSAAEVLAHCALHLSGHKRPRAVQFRARLPRSPVGKVLRHALREDLGTAAALAARAQRVDGAQGGMAARGTGGEPSPAPAG
jgi:long-chain acyl-CoA synthetase